MNGMENLNKILNKSPIINTYPATLFSSEANNIDEYYSEIASTHMSLGDTAGICNRIITCLVDNKSTFNGAVVGEYGFGKTSLLIYLWHHCVTNKILAVPPYQWSHFHEHFTAIGSWVRYVFRRQSVILREIDKITNKFSAPSLKSKAEEMASLVNIPLSDAYAYIEKEFSEGSLILDFSAIDLMHFCKELTIFITENTEWKGMLVITDELQQTISQLSQRNVYDYLFDITNYLSGNQGNYGFLWGFPTNTHADLGRTRGDILDRLNSNGVFIRLSELYDNKFPLYLWNKYKTSLNIDDTACPIVNENTLISIGQVCDGERRDLGNGPRSVTSAFNLMARHFLDTQETYEVIDFVNDCLDQEIMLGETSVYKKTIDDVIDIESINEELQYSVKILAGYPAGIPQDAIQHYKIKDDLEKLVRRTGGLGRIVTKNLHNYYLLTSLQKKVSFDHELSEIEEEVRNFYINFSDDQESRKIALIAFNNILTNQVFTKANGTPFESWNVVSDWRQTTMGFECYLTGSFSSKYPKRNVGLLTKLEGFQENVFLSARNNHVAYTFVLFVSDEIRKNSIIKKDKKEFLINLDLTYKQDKLGLSKVSQIIPDESHTPLLFLNMINHLSKANINSSEYQERDHLIAKITENIIFNLFNQELLGEIENTDIELNSQGKDLIIDLFTFFCQSQYSKYITIHTCRDWEAKIDRYTNSLKQDNSKITLLQRRGKEQIVLSTDRNENKEQLANFFGQKRTNFEPWLSGLESFVDYKPHDNYFCFLQHPLESFIADYLNNHGVAQVIDLKPSIKIDFSESLSPELRSLGYLNEEIDKIFRICSARKYFIYDKDNNSIFRIKEDKESLIDLCKQLYDEVTSENSKLAIFDDYNIKEDFQISPNLISAVESEEQSDSIVKILKRCQEENIYYCNKKIDRIKINITHAKNDLKEIEVKLNNKVSILKSELPGIAKWKMKLVNVRMNLESELEAIRKRITKTIEELNIVEITSFKQDKTIIHNLLQLELKLRDLFSSCIKEIDSESSILIRKINGYEKWNPILKIQEGLFEQISKFENIIKESTEYIQSLEKIDEEIVYELNFNQNNTLSNNELYRIKFIELRNQHSQEIENLKAAWEAAVNSYEKSIKKISGSLPQWRLRWSTPGIAYADLYESVKTSLINEIKRQLSLYSQLSDDVKYTKEVLNHKQAITNKQIDVNIFNNLESLDELLVLDVSEICRNNKEAYNTIIKKLCQFNEDFGRLNSEHQKIIKPTPIEDIKEKQFIEIIDKTEAKDLKRIIFDFHRINPDTNLTDCRDQILEIVKSLFIKKQLTIQIKKGKV